jgi:uncharacterized lipoprotein YddW (UPF0748 family)
MLKKFLIVIIGLITALSCSKKPVSVVQTIPTEIDKVIVSTEVGIRKREFRGAWVATIANIDWPSKKGLPSDVQKEEFSTIVHHHKAVGINALLVQIRASSDAFYAKSNEPWSEWLMGEQGIAPKPYYDPMAFMIDECHKNGMEFHAWLNLNRGKHKQAGSVMNNHLIYTKPEWFLNYDGYILYNFGLPAVRQYIVDVVLNIVREYEVDGIHFDDYFYPYKVNGQNLNDEATFRKYSNGFSSIEDWRRNNIDLIIKQLSDEIKKEKSWVSFGISPFGVWRNKSDDPLGSETKGGQPSYDLLFADTRKWAMEGWIDYIAPQIYFPFEHKLVPYGTLTDWWAANHGQANLYIGHGVYRVDEESATDAWKDPNQIARQIDYNRYSSEVAGSIFYNTNTLMRNNLGLRDSIQIRYPYPALGLEVLRNDVEISISPSSLLTENTSGGLFLKWKNDTNKTVLYRFKKGEQLNIGDPRQILGILTNNQFLDKTRSAGISYVYVLTSINKWNNESKPLVFEK